MRSPDCDAAADLLLAAVRATAVPAALSDAVRRVIASQFPDLVLSGLETMNRFPAALGVALGLAAAFLPDEPLMARGAVDRLGPPALRSQTADPLAFGAAPALLMAVAPFDCAIPARRARKVDPIVALRYE